MRHTFESFMPLYFFTKTIYGHASTNLAVSVLHPRLINFCLLEFTILFSDWMWLIGFVTAEYCLQDWNICGRLSK